VKVGITGFPGSGKSTIFQSLAPGAPQSKGRAPVLGNIKIPDERVDFLTGVFQPKKKTFAEITFVDVPGGGDPKAGALAPNVVDAMRSEDLLVHVVRCFDHPFSGEAGTPQRDRAAYRSELILADMVVLEKRLERLSKEGRKEGDAEVRTLRRCIEALEDEIPLRRLGLSDEEQRLLRSYAPLSLKPLMTRPAGPIPPASRYATPLRPTTPTRSRWRCAARWRPRWPSSTPGNRPSSSRPTGSASRRGCSSWPPPTACWT